MFGTLSELSNRLNWFREMDPLFWGENGHEAAFQPPMNVWEDGDKITVEIEIPGLKIEDVELSFNDGELTLKGEKKFESKENAPLHRRERIYGAFARSLSLPWPIDAERISAELKDGVLMVTLPKTEAAKPRRIEVKRIEKK